MGLQGDGLEAEAVGVDVKILVGDEEEIVLAGCAEASQPRELDGLFRHELGLQRAEEFGQDLQRGLIGDVVGRGV